VHYAAANGVSKKPEAQRVKEVAYLFPDSLTCHQKYINDPDEPQFLTDKFVCVKTECGTMFQYCTYVRWDFVIDGEARVLTIKTKKKKNRDDEVAI
jgi:hypothetical protein